MICPRVESLEFEILEINQFLDEILRAICLCIKEDVSVISKHIIVYLLFTSLLLLQRPFEVWWQTQISKVFPWAKVAGPISSQGEKWTNSSFLGSSSSSLRSWMTVLPLAKKEQNKKLQFLNVPRCMELDLPIMVFESLCKVNFASKQVVLVWQCLPWVRLTSIEIKSKSFMNAANISNVRIVCNWWSRHVFTVLKTFICIQDRKDSYQDVMKILNLNDVIDEKHKNIHFIHFELCKSLNIFQNYEREQMFKKLENLRIF